MIKDTTAGKKSGRPHLQRPSAMTNQPLEASVADEQPGSDSELDLQPGSPSKLDLKPVADGPNQVWEPGIWARLPWLGLRSLLIMLLCRLFLCPSLETKIMLLLL